MSELIDALLLRQQATKASVQKYKALQNSEVDGLVKHVLQFYGAARTGRFAGRIFQPQNIPSATFDDIELAIELIKDLDAGTIECLYGSVMDVLSGCIRSAIRAPDGKKLVVSDLNAIENRVLGWAANDAEMLGVFENNLDPYKKFAVEMFNKAYEMIDKKERKLAKPPVLGCGYMLGKKGLKTYSEGYGIEIDEDEAQRQVDIFREMFFEVKAYWYEIENAFKRCIVTRKETEAGYIRFRYLKPTVQMILPSGRALTYIRPALEDRKTPWGEMRPQITYENLNDSRQWVRVSTHPGKITENAVQAIARDILMHGIRAAERRGFDVILHVHDEIICLVDEDSELNDKVLSECMSIVPKWAPGLPLAAEGFESKFYRKD